MIRRIIIFILFFNATCFAQDYMPFFEHKFVNKNIVIFICDTALGYPANPTKRYRAEARRISTGQIIKQFDFNEFNELEQRIITYAQQNNIPYKKFRHIKGTSIQESLDNWRKQE